MHIYYGMVRSLTWNGKFFEHNWWFLIRIPIYKIRKFFSFTVPLNSNSDSASIRLRSSCTRSSVVAIRSVIVLNVRSRSAHFRRTIDWYIVAIPHGWKIHTLFQIYYKNGTYNRPFHKVVSSKCNMQVQAKKWCWIDGIMNCPIDQQINAIPWWCC